MKRTFLGLFGMVFGVILFLPSFLIGKTFGGHSAVSANPAVLAIQATGALIFVGAPLLYWVFLPLAEREQRKRNEV